MGKLPRSWIYVYGFPPSVTTFAQSSIFVFLVFHIRYMLCGVRGRCVSIVMLFGLWEVASWYACFVLGLVEGIWVVSDRSVWGAWYEP